MLAVTCSPRRRGTRDARRHLLTSPVGLRHAGEDLWAPRGAAGATPSRGQLTRAALKRKKILKQHKADLERFPVADGETLHDWISGFLDAGERLHSMLSDRADVKETSRKGAGALRAATIGLLSRLRAGLTDEVEHNSKLPSDLDAQVFGYLDELHVPRAAAARVKKKRAVPEAPAPPAPSGPS
ncbi:hypothetical protein [Sorangium sp. So ce887]|uniref:hypothetical protein n=1 Tax=Sorangium sp. So ce887 TaxID=3133324 RepID=UPI003F61C5C6